MVNPDTFLWISECQSILLTWELAQCILWLTNCCSCDQYTNRTEPWRNLLFTSSSFPGYPKNVDAGLVGKWWRFTGIGGDRIITNCHGGPIGGTEYPIRLAFSYPTTESDSATTGTAYGDTKERAFLGNMDQQLKDNEGIVLPEPVSAQQ
uniref:Uncharacterized protein n=1 Tax=Seriola dumerili TaxID=41447 RepID=A0A3B4T487_SERDU